MTKKAQEVHFPRVEQLEGYLALPEEDGGERYPGVVVAHEIFGLNDNVRGVADRLAANGYAALAVDLFAGSNRVVRAAKFTGDMVTNSLAHGGIRDLKSALSYLAGLEAVDEDRLAAVGFSMGGSLVMAWACVDERLKAVSNYYGVNPRPLEAVCGSCPVVGSYPEKDFTRAQGEALERELARCRVPHDIKVYPGARHSFFNEDREKAYDPQAAEDSWRRTMEFFGEYVSASAADKEGLEESVK